MFKKNKRRKIYSASYLFIFLQKLFIIYYLDYGARNLILSPSEKMYES